MIRSNIDELPDYVGIYHKLKDEDLKISPDFHSDVKSKFGANSCLLNAYNAALAIGGRVVEGVLAIFANGQLVNVVEHSWNQSEEGYFYDVTKDYIWSSPEFIKRSTALGVVAQLSYCYFKGNQYSVDQLKTLDSAGNIFIGFKFRYDSLKSKIREIYSTPFSVLMSVYRNDNPQHFKKAVESVSKNQKICPSEIVIVVDGPVSDKLDVILKRLCEEISAIKIIRLEKNGGLGNALRKGMQMVSHDIVARMDADDIASSDRFEKQIFAMASNPEYSMIGGQISEFIGEEDNLVGKREVPCSNEEIYNWIRKRCPFNHMTVMFRKSKILEVGNYIDWHYNEDYYLWIRMAETGCKFANLSDILVNVRVGKDMYARRGGWKYFKSEKGLQDYMYKRKMISFPQYLFNVAVRFGVQVALPNKVRGFIFQKLFRKS